MGRKKKSKLIGRTVLLVLLALVLLIVVSYFYVKNYDKALDATNEVYFTVTIPQGSSTTKIGTILQENEIISSGLIFKLKSKLNKLDGKFQAGDYKLSPSMTMNQIMESLQNAKAKEVKITIPEGWTLTQVGKYLIDNGFAKNLQEFYAACEENYNYDFLPKTGTAVRDISAKANRLEGYLYPETYYIYENSDLHTIIDTLLNEFDKRFTDDLKNKIPKSYTLNDIIAIASIVEEECGCDKDRPIIAGIIWHRLDIGMKLQCDVTISYALYDDEKFTTDLDSPYNTYKIEGIPAGPICSPSMKSIQATLEPEKTNYLYWCYKGDGSGESFFTDDYDQHKKNYQIYLENLKKQ